MPTKKKKKKHTRNISFIEYLTDELGIAPGDFYEIMGISRQAFWQAAYGSKARKKTTCEFLVDVAVAFNRDPIELFKIWLSFKDRKGRGKHRFLSR